MPRLTQQLTEKRKSLCSFQIPYLEISIESRFCAKQLLTSSRSYLTTPTCGSHIMKVVQQCWKKSPWMTHLESETPEVLLQKRKQRKAPEAMQKKHIWSKQCFVLSMLEDSNCMRAGRSCSLLTDHLPRHENEHRATIDLQLQLCPPQHPHLEQWQWHSKAGQTKTSFREMQGGSNGSSPTFR
ncbi:hypothetical protein CIB84_000186 [Bambusicola thoracicus]|uniref:Uncharacterized protein n=1 Tax=Bambusicola thoracicus TaxID=9083 RepID=A0A2P4TI75_BAMTH|nr:hypothetical protein CIB84_000186 [Bambusicola thoracicus]